MRYVGGKTRIGEDIAHMINEHADGYNCYLEPFVGAASVLQYVKHKHRIASDIHLPLIEMYQALQRGWEPPTEISKIDHEDARHSNDLAYRAFVGFFCSHSGRYFSGYAEDARGYNYAKGAHDGLMKMIPRIKDVWFLCKDYRDLKPTNAIIYCDPPYEGSVECCYVTMRSFKIEEFHNHMRVWAKNNLVFISGYDMPDDFKCIQSYKLPLTIRKTGEIRDDRIFVHRTNLDKLNYYWRTQQCT